MTCPKVILKNSFFHVLIFFWGNLFPEERKSCLVNASVYKHFYLPICLTLTHVLFTRKCLDKHYPCHQCLFLRYQYCPLTGWSDGWAIWPKHTKEGCMKLKFWSKSLLYLRHCELISNSFESPRAWMGTE